MRRPFSGEPKASAQGWGWKVEFRWNACNIEHVLEHGVLPDEAEFVVAHAAKPFPEYRGDDKWAVWGPTTDGLHLQVVYIFDPGDTIYVIHARPLTKKEKRRYRRRKR
jgi:uncharacterized DUF497 family protein